MTRSGLYSPLCNQVIGHDKNGRNICCDKPRCDEAGRRRLCLEHWQEELQRRQAKSTDRLARHLQPPTPRERAIRRALAEADTPSRVYGYVRVSTAQQVDEGQSLDVQQRTIQGYCQMHGLTLDKTFIERGVSGSKPLGDRPQGKALLAALKPGDTAIVTALDRAFRSALDSLQTLEQMQKARIALHVVGLGGDVSSNGSNITSRLVFGILSHVAQFEKERLAERVAEVKADQRKQGRYLGGRKPFGYRVGDDGELVPIPEQQAAIKQMRKLHKQGHSLRAIASAVTAEGLPISYVGVRDILARTA